MKIQFIAILFFSFFIISCDLPKYYFDDLPECTDNPSEYNINSDSYDKDRVIEKLLTTQPTEYRYRFETFVEDDVYAMVVNFRKDSTCMDVLVHINQLGKLKGMYQVNGKAYPNELYDLIWEIKDFDGERSIWYKDMHDIID